MAKRFTDTDKWKKKFIRGLEASYKLLWFYILDDCDHAGIWHVDMEVARIKVGENISESGALEFFAGKILVFDDNEKWFIPDFIEFQYGSLSENNRAHLSVINVLTRYGLIDNKGYIRGLEGAKDKEQDKDMDKVKDKVKDKDKDKEPKNKIAIINENQNKKLHLFEDSEFYDLDKFKAEFVDTKYQMFSMDFYYEAVKNWSESGGNKKKDWVATARGFMTRDYQDGNPVYAKGILKNDKSKIAKIRADKEVMTEAILKSMTK